MTIIEMITDVDAMKPNGYEQIYKIQWLSHLDGRIKNEIIDAHECADMHQAIDEYIQNHKLAYEREVEEYAKENEVSIEEARANVEYREISYKEAKERIKATRSDIFFDGYNAETPLDTELIVPHPYDDVYRYWLEAQIDYANGEYAKYNNSMSMFNEAYSAFYRYYHKTHMPKGKNIKFF